VTRQAESIGLDSVDRLLEQLDRELGGDLPPLRVKDVISMLVRRDGAYSFSGFLAAVGSRLWREVAAGSGLLGRLVILALLCGILENIQSAFARPQTTELAFGACYLVLIIMAVGGFLLAMDVCRGVIDRLVDFMQAMLPVLITLLVGVGAVTTAGLFHPVLVVSVQFIAGFVRDVILPVVLCAACIDLVSRTFTRFKLTALSDLLRQGAVVVTGLLLSVFVGVVSVYGAAGSVFDGAAIKAAKFATSTFIPFLGKLLADAVEVVIGSSLVLKNVIGVVGALGVVAYTVFPLLKVLALVIIFRVAGALVQPLGAGQLVGSLNSAANSIVLMMVMACAVAVMFLVTLAIVVGAATAAVMVR
jgi:stage III sporulation protein AE